MKTRLPGIITSVACTLLLSCPAGARADEPLVTGARKINPTTIEVTLRDLPPRLLDFHGENVFRLFQDNDGGIVRDPDATPPARILVDAPRAPLSRLLLDDDGETIVITTEKIRVLVDKRDGRTRVMNHATGAVVLEEAEPLDLAPGRVTLTLRAAPGEYFYGGGVQNGRFSHKGKSIAIENQNSWTDGGVASPAPFCWSTGGYGVMWHTFKKGRYDFEAKEKGIARLYHETGHADIFFFFADTPAGILGAYYQLTGHPALLPRFAFYQGHLNAYNRDYWKEDSTGIPFEDGKRYKESQRDNGGIKESLNGENNNYLFSARAVIDRYKLHDMPLGWILPNDGYGAGYGQAGTLDGNIANLKALGDHARANGVEIGLWTQSDLHPRPGISALLQRDLVKEVRDAGVRVLKTDVAWVGAGYSFGLHGITGAARVMSYYGNNCRPFIITLDGWAGTQRHAAVWTGDQTGGQWEYIRFHVPTYIGAGLSGIPNITSDMDGIFGGKNPVVNTRDFQWKAFTPMQLNMDGWGTNEKYPHAPGEPAASINRWYLKLKSMLMPYAYSIAREAVDGLPVIRATFLDTPSPYTMGTATRYQFLYGPFLLVAPVYRATRPDADGNDIRDGIYLPGGHWIDPFTGKRHEGNRVINNVDAPLWKLPVFARAGAILPVSNPHNNPAGIQKEERAYVIYPGADGAFTEYDDDGISEEYKAGRGAWTRVTAREEKGRLVVTVDATRGDFDGLVKEKSTGFTIITPRPPARVTARVGNKRVRLARAPSRDACLAGENTYFHDDAPAINRFATPGSEFAKRALTGAPRLLVRLAPADITANDITLVVDGLAPAPDAAPRAGTGPLAPPAGAGVPDNDREPRSLRPAWRPVENADYYEIEFLDMLYSTIRDTSLLFEELTPATAYTFKLRAVNRDGHSPWCAFEATTAVNPLEFAIREITGESTAADQPGSGIQKLFDHDEESTWHTAWKTAAVPFELVLDLHAVYLLDKLHYLPRVDGGNGTITRGTVAWSRDKERWSEPVPFAWSGSASPRVLAFPGNTRARYVKIHVTASRRDFGSGRELYVFKVPGTEGILPGDINNDHRVDENDLTSYRNYTGLRRGDADFEGYVSNGDMNQNDLIDALDISFAATRLDGGVTGKAGEPVSGRIEIVTAKRAYRAGEVIEVRARGIDLRSVNAFSLALPYDPRDMEFVDLQPLAARGMENMTNDRLHADGAKALYPTFVHTGDKEPLEGTLDLFVARFKATRAVKITTIVTRDGLLVDKHLRSRAFTRAITAPVP
jgi:hypothetical protein